MLRGAAYKIARFYRPPVDVTTMLRPCYGQERAKSLGFTELVTVLRPQKGCAPLPLPLLILLVGRLVLVPALPSLGPRSMVYGLWSLRQLSVSNI